MTKNTRKALYILTAMTLIAAMSITVTGCGKSDGTTVTGFTVVGNQELEPIGEGENEFTFLVTDAEGSTHGYEVHTDETVVGKALLSLGLIEGEDGDYGLYVKTVDGITLDFDTDGKYWAFYADGAYANSGVDTTDIDPDTAYEFRAE